MQWINAMEQMNKRPKTIAIDGPAASGKSSVGQHIANNLGYMFLDTGIMYRAVAWASVAHGIEVTDEHKVGELARSINISVQKATNNTGRLYDICVDSQDVTDLLRSPEVNQNVSQVSRYAAVRDAMTAQQKVVGKQGSIVMAGRDIGTVVLPDADLKFYLEASPAERARRRFAEEQARGGGMIFEQILQNIEMRDEIDSTREIAPLKPAEDARIINTDGKSIQLVINEIMQIIERHSESN